jgi:erythromycin esterase-like protein
MGLTLGLRPRRELTGNTIVEAYQRHFRQISFEHKMGAVLAEWQEGDRSGAVEQVSDQMTDQLAVWISCPVLGPLRTLYGRLG